jgi:two-component system, chemotaxis family, protein-glutamate methylesterase/glutaminase
VARRPAVGHSARETGASERTFVAGIQGWMPALELVAIGASAGGVDALRDLLGRLPPRFPAAVAVVLHLSPDVSSRLAAVLARAGSLPAVEVVEERPLVAGTVYVATPNRHLVVGPTTVRSDTGPRENRHRPSIDVLFRSAAETFGARVAAVVLSGTLDDGTAGLATIADAGGVTIVQDPAEASQPSMPESAMRGARVDHVLPAASIGDLLGRIVSGLPEPADAERPSSDPGGETIAPFACPECNGTLWETRRKSVSQFRCRVGHAFSEGSVVAENGRNLERALWTALRVLEERAALLEKLARTARQRELVGIAEGHERKAARTRADAALLRDVVLRDVERHVAG